jgi:hypothetical protein
MATPRSDVVSDGQAGVYHCISRCVRHALLCGYDHYLNRSLDYRKLWIKDRLQCLVSYFAVDVCSYSILSNQLHVVIRTAPDRVADWTDENVARRWLTVFPKTSTHKNNVDNISASEIKTLAMNKKRVREIRGRLSSVSWFMRCLNEYISRRANKEDDCRGRFWEGRFKCITLLDDSAVLACMAYVDLSLIRTDMVGTPEESEFTGVYDRIAARERPPGSSPDQQKSNDWLCPVTTAESSQPNSLLDMEFDDYLRLIDWTSRQIRQDKPDAIPGDLALILDRLQVDAEHWLQTVTRFENYFHRDAGRVKSMTEVAKQRGVRWLRGSRASRQAFKGD